MCGYPLLATNPERTVLISIASEHLSLSKLGWEENRWLNVGYVVLPESMTCSVDRLDSAVKRAFGESEYAITAYRAPDGDLCGVNIAFGQAHTYYEIDIERTERLGWIRHSRDTGAQMAVPTNVFECELLDAIRQELLPLLAARPLR